MNTSKQIRGYLYIIASAVIFGCMPMMAKFIYAEGVNSLSLVFLRNILSVPLLAIMGFCQKKTLRIPVKALPSVAMVALMGCCLTPLLLFSSYRFIASGPATVFHFIYPAVVVLLGVIFMREKVKPGNLISVLICVAGICLFYTPGEPLDMRGSFLALLSGVTYSIYVLLLSYFKHKEVSGFLFNFYIAIICSCVLFAACLASGQLALPISIQGWLLSIFFALTINVGAVVLFQQGTFLIGGQKASILSTVEPITSIFLGAVVFHEAISLRTFMGSALVITASILIALLDMKKKEV